MRLECSNADPIDDPDDAAIANVIATLGDASDFARLFDAALGELRAAGPAADGTFLLQCELPSPVSTFEGEGTADSSAEVASLFQRFRRGDTEWRSDFAPLGTPLFRHGRHRFAAIVAAVILFVLAALWRAV